MGTNDNDKKYINIKKTTTGYSFSVNKEDTKLWGDTVVDYFNCIEGYDVDHKECTISATIGIKNIRFKKKKDFTVTVYKSTGTIQAQTKKGDEFFDHLKKITEIMNVEIVMDETIENNPNETATITQSEIKDIRYQITKDDQAIIAKNMEETIKVLEESLTKGKTTN